MIVITAGIIQSAKLYQPDKRALGTSYDNRNDSKAASIYTTKTFSNRRNFISKEFEEAHFWAFTTPSNERAFAKAVKAAA